MRPPPAPDRVSVIIPAHDEAGVIGRCLGRLLEGAHPGELDVVVVCNGCSDGTADVVRSAWPGVRVVELSSAGKARALNAGDEAAATFPRVYLDADVEVTVEDVRLVAQSLRSPGVLCAAPTVRFAVEDRPWAIRKFYEAWTQLPYLNDAMVGSGFFALSAEGRRRFASFPEDLIADDQFVLDHFSPGERASVPEATFVVHPPRRLRSLIAVRTRAYRGNRQLARRATTPERQVSRRAAVLRLARPGTLTALAVYAGVNLLAEARSRRAAGGWERDE
ncbi:MAG TPA: glycosyltransferase, partial [Acidimicrobiales bacterium]|nr:glycosyltransferase [Acidimicrobiales bacterium]